MPSRQLLSLVILVASVAASTGCQPSKPTEKSRSIGRTAMGPINNFNGQYQPFQSNTSAVTGTQWGQITSNQGDQAFDGALYYMTYPMLAGAPADQQLGYVSASPNQNTSVVFWGQASMYNAGGYGGTGSGVLDGSSARIHIEVWDDKAVSSMGTSPIVLHIGYDFPGFVGAQGSVQNNQVNLVFQDKDYGAVALQGNLNGSYFIGTLYFSNSQTGGQYYPLGTFQVPACGFFICN